jgi:hypothetical protein
MHRREFAHRRRHQALPLRARCGDRRSPCTAFRCCRCALENSTRNSAREACPQAARATHVSDPTPMPPPNRSRRALRLLLAVAGEFSVSRKGTRQPCGAQGRGTAPQPPTCPVSLRGLPPRLGAPHAPAAWCGVGSDARAHRRPPPLLAAGALLLAAAPALAQDCRARLLEASPASGSSLEWVDVDTPTEACSKSLPGFDATYQVRRGRGGEEVRRCLLVACSCVRARLRPTCLTCLDPPSTRAAGVQRRVQPADRRARAGVRGEGGETERVCSTNAALVPPPAAS